MTKDEDQIARDKEAIARIEAVPAGSTLIDMISNDDWHGNSVGDWKIEAGSDEAGPSEELDDSDKETNKE